MKPTLFSFHVPLLGEVDFPAYFTLLTLGFALAIWITWRDASRVGLDRERVLDLDLWMVVWGLVGARALHLIADGHLHEYIDLCRDPRRVPAVDALVRTCVRDAQCGYDYVCDATRHVCHPPRDCLAALKLWRGGLAYYGGFICAVAFAIRFSHRHGMPFWRVADLAAAPIALGLFFGRVGCYLAGCCYGKPSEGPLGVVFPRYSAAWRAQLDVGLISAREAAHAVHPTQLYEALGCLSLFVLLYFYLRPRKRHDGELLGWLLILYGALRSVIEVWRDDDRGVFLGGYLSTSQLLSVPLIVAGVLLIRRRRQSPDTTPD